MKNSTLITNIINQEIDPAFAYRAQFISDALQEKKPKKILDAGCGRGFYVKLASLMDFPEEIIGVDINERYVKLAQKLCQKDSRLKIKKASIYRLPFPDNYFDAVICSEVLEHLINDKGALAELHRVLKRNGIICISVPNLNFPLLWDPLNWLLIKLFNKHIDKNIWWLAGIWADHERLYSKEAITNLVSEKFVVKKRQLFLYWCWPFSHFLLYGLGKNIVERLGVTATNRFNFEKEGRLSFLAARFFSFPSRFDNNLNKTSMDIAIVGQKK